MPASPIERLPAELLQPIFVASSYNLALAQASNLMGARLSDEYIYNSACAHYLGDACNSHAERSTAQAFIFSRKWMTWAFFKTWIVKAYGPKGCLCGRTPTEGCFDAQWPPNFEDVTTMVFTRSHLPRLAFIRGRLPPKLLHGPWTPERIQFLRFLLWLTSMTVDWSDSEARRAAMEGRQSAMLDRSLNAVELFNHNRRLGKASTLETVRFAVMEAGCDRSIVYDTMLTAHMWGLRGESWQCCVLDQWCEERIAEQDKNGRWVQTKLKVLRSGADISNLKDDSRDEYALVSDNPGEELIVNNLMWNKVSSLIIIP
jgi:hypothetical protein